MNTIRAKINLALETLIEEKNGIVFQRLAFQCLRSRWPSLASVAEQADLGEDAITILDETSDGVIRSLVCSLTAKWGKVSSDARKVAKNRSDIQELIFATPKTVTRKTQKDWGKKVKKEFGWKLIVIERSEFLTKLEHPESQWICKEYLQLSLGYLYLLKSAEVLKDSEEIEASLKKANDAERGALDARDWETLCRAQLLLAELHLEKNGLCSNYRNKAFEALSTARESGLTYLLAESLTRYANSVIAKKPREARNLLEQAESLVGDDLKIKRWIYLVRAELEHRQGELNKAVEALKQWELLTGKNTKIDRQSFYHIKFRLEIGQGNHAEALGYLNKALKRAQLKKRWVSVGWMLQEKARYLAHKRDFRKAAREAEKSREAFGKADVEEEAFNSALLSGHLFFESHDAERALGLADYVLSRADPAQYTNMHLDALQLKTKSLQILTRIEEARASNKRFREISAYNPQSLVVADIQDAILFAQSGDYENAESIIKQCFERAKSTHVKEEFLSAIKVHWAQIMMEQAKYRDARLLAEGALQFADKLPPKVREEAANIVKVAKGRAPLSSIFEDLLNSPDSLKLSGTESSRNIQEAHKELVRPLLDWTDKWPKAIQEIYDFWGRGNLVRYILNHRGYQNSFHMTVEATTVEEARQWARVLCPIVDVLTILWKGPILSGGIAVAPVHHSYDGPGGWGYMIAAGDEMRPNENSDDWNWSPAMGWATLLPNDAVKFLFEEARSFFEAGRLFLFPAVNVGCIDPGHGPLERMFNDVTNASSSLGGLGNNSHAMKLDLLPLPFFPDVPLHELARMVEGEGDSLLKTRQALFSWARAIADQNTYETAEIIRECYDQVKIGLRETELLFEELARKLDWAQKGGEIYSYVLDVEKFSIEPKSLAAAELAALHEKLHASPWYGYFRLGLLGYRWDLMRKGSRSISKAPKRFHPDKVHHWLVPGKAGWTIPSFFIPT